MSELPNDNFYYNPKLKTRARTLRNHSTKSEIYLWKYVLSKKKMLGYTFLRQRPVLHYIADFMCKELKLIIEVDGITHLDEQQQEYDRIRQDNLEKVGFSILRFSSWEVLNRIHDVRAHIHECVELHSPQDE